MSITRLSSLGLGLLLLAFRNRMVWFGAGVERSPESAAGAFFGDQSS
jgi:hypothetical protein